MAVLVYGPRHQAPGRQLVAPSTRRTVCAGAGAESGWKNRRGRIGPRASRSTTAGPMSQEKHSMKACVLRQPAAVETQPLELREVPVPQPGEGEVLLRVSACGICRTDLHVVEGELPPKKPHIIPGHQIVGAIDRLGPEAAKYRVGDR